MKLELNELTRLDDVIKLYDVYKDCMYMPTPGKFESKMRAYLAEESIHIYGCCSGDTIVGVIVCSIAQKGVLEIVGIAVESTFRCKGIGRYMICKIKEYCREHTLYAETDGDAVGFYQKCGFSATEYMQEYDGQTVRRYKCTL